MLGSGLRQNTLKNSSIKKTNTLTDSQKSGQYSKQGTMWQGDPDNSDYDSETEQMRKIAGSIKKNLIEEQRKRIDKQTTAEYESKYIP